MNIPKGFPSTAKNRTVRSSKNVVQFADEKRAVWDEPSEPSVHAKARTVQLQPWQRILYAKQPYRDNHYDARTFFSHMTIINNASGVFLNSSSTSIWAYAQAILHASLLVQQFSAVTFFLTIYQLIRLEFVSLEALWLLNGVALLSGSIIYFWLLSPVSVPNSSRSTLLDRLRRLLKGISSSQSLRYNNDIPESGLTEFVRVSVLFIVCLKIAAPIIRTLTSAVSEDTIYAMAIILSGIHLLGHDYLPPIASLQSSAKQSNATIGASSSVHGSVVGDRIYHTNVEITQAESSTVHNDSTLSSVVPNNSIPGNNSSYNAVSRTKSVISLSTGMFTAVMLASRLHTADLVVAFVLFAIITFTLFPMICRLLFFGNASSIASLKEASRDDKIGKSVSESAGSDSTRKSYNFEKFGIYRWIQVVVALVQWLVTGRVVWLLDHPSAIHEYFIDSPNSSNNKMKDTTSNISKDFRDGHTLWIIYQSLVILFWLVGPILFVWLQRYKQILRGPWDIPHILNS